MLQEIITYLIIIASVFWAGYKIIKKFSRKKVRTKSLVYEKMQLAQHNCNDCSAECLMRDAIPPIKMRKQEHCRKSVRQ